MLSRPVISGAALVFCGTRPIDRRTASGDRATSWPATDAAPESARVSVANTLTVGGLSGSVGAEQPEDLAGADGKGQPAQGLDRCR